MAHLQNMKITKYLAQGQKHSTIRAYEKQFWLIYNTALDLYNPRNKYRCV